jgi:hypothetical protein
MRRYVVVLIVLLTVLSTNLFSEQVSSRRAMLYSALIPGLGEYSQGNTTRGSVFMTVEVLTILAYLRLDKEIGWKQKTYENYAYVYANVPKGSLDSYYRFIGQYQNSDIYNSEWDMYLRNRFLIYENDPETYRYYRDQILITGDEEWDWGSSEKFYRYRELRKEKQQLDIYINFTIGAAVLNRLISVIDTAIISKGTKGDNTLSNLKIIPDPLRQGHSLVYEYKF